MYHYSRMRRQTWAILAPAVHKCAWAVRMEFRTRLFTASSAVFSGESAWRPAQLSPAHSVRYVLHYVKALGSKRVIFPALIDEADVPMGRGFLS